MQELLAAGLPCKGAQSDNTLGVGGELAIEPWLAASTLLVLLRVWGDSAVGLKSAIAWTWKARPISSYI